MTAETDEGARFSATERDAIRRALKRYKEELDIGFDKLRRHIAKLTGVPEIDIDRRTLSRFVNGEHGTRDTTVGIYKQFVESLPEPDPIYDLGDAMSDFFGLPRTRKDRADFMEKMGELYLGEYRLFGKIPDGSVNTIPYGDLKIIADPLSAYFRAEEWTENRFHRPDDEREDVNPGTEWTWREGIAIPRESDLLIMLREVGSDDQKIYLLKHWQPDTPDKDGNPQDPMLGGYALERYPAIYEYHGEQFGGFSIVIAKRTSMDHLPEIDLDEED